MESILLKVQFKIFPFFFSFSFLRRELWCYIPIHFLSVFAQTFRAYTLYKHNAQQFTNYKILLLCTSYFHLKMFKRHLVLRQIYRFPSTLFVCKWVKFPDISLKSTCLFWSQCKRRCDVVILDTSSDDLWILWFCQIINKSWSFYFSTPFLIQSNSIINHIHFGRCVLITEIQYLMKKGGAYAIFFNSHVVDFWYLP